MNELARIAMIARMLTVDRGVSGESPEGVEVGIGDDAAVLLAPSANDEVSQPERPTRPTRPTRLVWTIDEQVEGTHFRRELATWQDVGWRSFQAAASDVAAMGAKAWCALSALVLPDSVDDAALEQIVSGQRDAAAAVGARIVGGNLSRGPSLSIATTLLGVCESAVTRGGAKPGDGLWLAGHVGLAACGLRALESGRAADPGLAAAIAAWQRPAALVEAGLAMAGIASAAIDVSDGLAQDVTHMAEASRVKVVLEPLALLSDSVLVESAALLGLDPLDLVLGGGEDYALIAASEGPIPGFRRVGSIEGGSGLVLRRKEGDTSVLVRGFDHFDR